MKRLAVVCLILSLFLSMTLAFGGPVWAADITVTVDGTLLGFDVPPVIVDGRVLVPLRVIFEALGAPVRWDAATRTITAVKGDTTIQLEIGSPNAYILGEPVALDVPAQIQDGRTLVPLRFVAEALGAAVAWDGATRSITITASLPIPPEGVWLAAGSMHSLAVAADGTVWAWGRNEEGQLGDGTTTMRSTPVQVQGMADVVAIAGAYYHTIALRRDGTVWAWGLILDGETPRVRLADVVAIAGGCSHTIALRRPAGTVWAWGANGFGQLGDGTVRDFCWNPVQAQGLTDVVAIAGGWFHTLALRRDGTVWAWGSNKYGQLGDGTTTDRLTPVQVQGMADVVAIAGGVAHTIALRRDGTVWAWGWNKYVQLGDGTTTDRLTPVQVQGMADVDAIAGGYYHTIALRRDGTVWAWGSNGDGQLGDGTTTNRSTPVQVQGIADVLAIAGGGWHTLALRGDGTVWAWGSDGFDQLGDGPQTWDDRSTPVQVQGLPDVGPQG